VAPPRAGAIDADDIAVMRGVLDSLQRPYFVVVDTTLAPCPVHPPRTSLKPQADCLSPEWLGYVSRFLPSDISRTGLLAFAERNRAKLAVTRSLGTDTTLISATVIDFVPSEDLVARHPQGTAVVTLSAPLYPAPGVAVVAYGLHQALDLLAVARLERQADGRWKTQDRVPGLTQRERLAEKSRTP
jgi:hypothetical protein